MIRWRRDGKGFEAVPAVIVADQTNKRGRRLAFLALSLLLLFFAAGGYIQSARNGDKLNRAAIDRSALINSVSNLTESNREQNRFIKKLQEAIKTQNKLLAKAGYRTIQIPSQNPPGSSRTGPNSNPNGPHPYPTPNPHSSPTPRPSSSPTPRPSSSPDPISSIKDKVCSLTGVCLGGLPIFRVF